MGVKIVGPACLDILTGVRDARGVSDIDRWRAANDAETPPRCTRGHGRLYTPSEVMRIAEERTVDGKGHRSGSSS